MRISLLVFLGTLCACSDPSLPMRGAIRHQVQIEHSRFTVHHMGNRAEAVRTSFETLPQQRGVMGRGRQAIEQATGCIVVHGSFDGDPALMRADLICPDSDAPA